ncbi:MAG: class I tRNA ligase family protein, partial [Candidatus Hodarchaeota archaeon]
DALKLLEHSFWNQFCSIFIESLKDARSNQLLSKEMSIRALNLLKAYLGLFAPFLPFVSEYCWAILWKTLTPANPFQSIHSGRYNGYNPIKRRCS